MSPIVEGVLAHIIGTDGATMDTDAAYNLYVTTGFIPKDHPFLELLAELKTNRLYTSVVYTEDDMYEDFPDITEVMVRLVKLITVGLTTFCGCGIMPLVGTVKFIDTEPIELISMICCDDEQPRRTVSLLLEHSDEWAASWVNKLELKEEESVTRRRSSAAGARHIAPAYYAA